VEKKEKKGIALLSRRGLLIGKKVKGKWENFDRHSSTIVKNNPHQGEQLNINKKNKMYVIYSPQELFHVSTIAPNKKT
jgi:hypothetical protein